MANFHEQVLEQQLLLNMLSDLTSQVHRLTQQIRRGQHQPQLSPAVTRWIDIVRNINSFIHAVRRDPKKEHLIMLYEIYDFLREKYAPPDLI